ncbi:nuclear transport factor 2 family protein [Dyella tabacisoli]|uniref:Nuclear transport factor 2 family protein n=1 Tax=Dyella tabacisoli TaxID=2282381 RepID=A0A369UT28_9GAMM|nr:nuclear transport factor 2 family protein [Dyella tabacisoli]RDD81499.1 nuclear transport factor 2 family protein [Dyella tabacisoli]
MNQSKQIVERYIQSWNETDPLRRRVLIEELYTEHAVYTDPMIEAKGWEAIDATITAVQGMFPGHVFRLDGVVDAHHDMARFRWHLGTQDASEPLVIGFDVAALEGDRIRQVFGFLDKVPQAA